MEVNINVLGIGNPTPGLPPFQSDEHTAQPLKLFVVTLAWNPSDSSERDYCENVWATDESDAIRQLAEEMSQHVDCRADSDEERAKFVQCAVENASTYSATCVATEITANLRDLIEPHRVSRRPVGLSQTDVV